MSEQRWTAHPRAATAVRAVVLLGPLTLAVATGVASARVLDGVPGRLPLVLALTLAVLVVTDRLARRLLPLATLLGLSLLFPDRAPGRARLALRAGSTRELLRAGRKATPAGEAAQQVLVLLARTTRHDRGTRRHSERVRAYVDLLAEALRLPRPDQERLR